MVAKHDVDEVFAVVTAAGASLVQLVFADFSLEVCRVLRHQVVALVVVGALDVHVCAARTLGQAFYFSTCRGTGGEFACFGVEAIDQVRRRTSC